MAHTLAVLHILAVFVCFAVCSLLLYLKLVQQLDEASKGELKAETVSIKSLLSAPDGLQLLEKEMVAQLHEVDGHHVCVRILDRDEKVVVENQIMRQWIPGSAFPPPAELEARKFRAASGALYLIKNSALHDPVSEANGWRLQVGIDVSGNEKLAATYRSYLFAFALGGFCFALLSSIVVVLRGLKPLNDFSSELRRVSEGRLATRVDPASYPVEMESLVRSFNGMMACLDGSFQRLSHYSGNLAHELRTPINTLMLQAEIALSKDRALPEYRELITSCLDEYQRLADIVDKLLFLARADGRKGRLLLQELDVEEEAEEVLDYFIEEAKGAGVRLHNFAQGMLLADQTLFRRALSNLVSNAIRHTPDGGQVSVSSSLGEAGRLEVRVCDTGCGIATEHLPLLFDRFYRAGAESGGGRSGTGLGLAIVRAIMVMHGGDAAVWSEQGQGTVVTLYFPVQPSSSGTAEAPV